MSKFSDAALVQETTCCLTWRAPEADLRAVVWREALLDTVNDILRCESGICPTSECFFSYHDVCRDDIIKW